MEFKAQVLYIPKINNKHKLQKISKIQVLLNSKTAIKVAHILTKIIVNNQMITFSLITLILPY